MFELFNEPVIVPVIVAEGQPIYSKNAAVCQPFFPFDGHIHRTPLASLLDVTIQQEQE